jgi:hypothetical protein
MFRSDLNKCHFDFVSIDLFQYYYSFRRPPVHRSECGPTITTLGSEIETHDRELTQTASSRCL